MYFDQEKSIRQFNFSSPNQNSRDILDRSGNDYARKVSAWQEYIYKIGHFTHEALRGNWHGDNGDWLEKQIYGDSGNSK